MVADDNRLMSGEQTPDPIDRDAERRVLRWVLLTDRPAYARFFEQDELEAADFGVAEHRVIFTAMTLLFADRLPIDVLTVADRLEKHEELEAAGGDLAIHRLTAEGPPSIGPGDARDADSRRLKDLRRRREADGA